MAQQEADAVAVQAAVEDGDVLFFLTQHVEDGEAAEVAVLQLLHRLAEQHAAYGLVAVKQEEAALRLAGQQAAGDREDRRDTGPGGESRDRAGRIRRVGEAEAAGGRHHLNLVAGRERLVSPGGEGAAIDALDRDAQLTVIRAGADRV